MERFKFFYKINDFLYFQGKNKREESNKIKGGMNDKTIKDQKRNKEKVER